METSTVRSVRVQMNADVAKYIADMRLAGAETRKAFDGSSAAGLNRELQGTQQRLQSTTAKTKEYTLAQALADEKTARLRSSLRDQAKAMIDAESGTKRLSNETRKAAADLDTFTGRMSLAVKGAVALGPALVPLTAGLVPAVTGLTAGTLAAASAAGVAMLAFNGVGDAVKAIDNARLDPTTENLQKMHQALADLGPQGAEFARFIDGLEPKLRELQSTSRVGLPGLQDSISELLTTLPQVKTFVAGISTELGDLARDSADGLLHDSGFQKFFRYLQTDGRQTMDNFARATGKLASGLVSLFTDMAPLTRDFTSGLLHGADSFQKWADKLGNTQGFRDFLATVQQDGPRVVDLLGAVGSTFVQIVQAAEPVGSVTLPLLTSLVDLLGKVADSPLGPLIVTFAAVNSAISIATLAVDKLAASWGRVAAAAGGAAEAEATAAAAGAGGGATGLLGKLGTVAGTALTLGAGAWGTSALMSKLTNAKVDPSNGITAELASKLAGNIDLTTSSRGWFGGFGAKAIDLLPGKDAYQVAQSNLSNTDLTLSQMVTSGQGAQAAAEFAKISAAAKDAGVSVGQVTKAFPNYSAAVKASASASDGFASATSGASSAAREEHQALTELVKSYHEQHTAALSAFDAVTQFGQAVQDAAAQAATGEKGLNQYTKAGVANRTALSGMIAAYNNQSAATKNNVRDYQAAKAKLVEFGQQMGLTKGQIAALTAQIDKPRKLTISAQTEAAMSQIRQVKAYLDSLHDRHINVTVSKNTNATIGELAAAGSADGSTVPKTGKPYADRHLYLLADGEEVISNRRGQADRFRPLLKAINAGRLAVGGTAGALTGNAFHSDISTTEVSSSSSSSSSKSKDEETKAEKKSAKAYAEATAEVIKTSASLHALQDSLGGVAKESRHQLAAMKAGAQRYKDFSAADQRRIALAEKQTLALSKMSIATEKQTKAFDRAASRAEDRLKTAADIAKQHRQAVLDDIASMREAITSRFTSDQLGTAASNAESSMSNVDLKSILEKNPYITRNQLLATVNTNATATTGAEQVAAAISGMNTETAQAQAFNSDLSKVRAALKKQGVSKKEIDSLMTYLDTNATVDQAAALAKSPALALQFDQAFTARSKQATATGTTQANAIYGAQAERALKVQNELLKEYREVKATSNKIHRKVEALASDISDMKTHGPKKTGEAVGQEINSALVAGMKKGSK